MSQWSVTTPADVALTAATPRTVIGCKAPTGAVLTLNALHLDFESVTASDVLALIELVVGAADGTGTSLTPQNTNRAHTAAASFAAKDTYTVEPGTLTVVKAWQYPVQGSVDIPLPVLKPYQTAAAGFIGVRVTTPQNQNCRASLDVED